MAVYRYTGFNLSGKSVTGVLDAPSEKLALDSLTNDGITPVSIENGEKAAPAKTGAAAAFSPRGRVPMTVRTLFVRELATFIHADVPLLEALDVLRRQESHDVFKKILADVHDRVQRGDSFSKALAQHPKVFSPLLVSMVKVAEAGGLLGPVLDQMATWMEHEEEVRSEIRSALAYPAMIVALGIVTVFVLMSFVLPRITEIFSGMQATLPWPTRFLMGTADFMGQYWWGVMIGAALFVIAAVQSLQTRLGKELFDRVSLRAPLFGDLTMKAGVARFARASAALLGSGVPLLEALKVVRDLLGNVVLTGVIDQTIERVTRGRSLAKSLGESPYFPPAAVHLLGVGERTGRLGDMFERVANSFEKQTRARIKVLLNLLSPVMIIALAAVVAFIAISILLPIFQMNKMVR